MSDHPIYPGHPVTIAYQIVRVFPSLAAATATGRAYRAALESDEVRGSGSAVSAALDFLRYALDPTVGWDRAVADADRVWQSEAGGAYTDRIEPGAEQAHRIAPLLRERLKTWGSP